MSIISEVPIFSELPQNAISWLAERSASRSYPRGTIVMAEGQAGSELFVIESGKAKVYVTNSDGRELVLYHAGPGDYVGEMSILDGEPRSATVQTLVKSSFLVLGQQDLHDLMAENPTFALAIVQTLTRKLRIATDQVRSLGLDPVYRRLTDLLKQRSETDPESGHEIVAKLSHRQIADHIGSSREMVSKLIRDLEKGQYIDSTEGRIVIKSRLPTSW